MSNEVTQNALNLFRNGSSCSQAVLSAYFKVMGLDEKFGHKLGTGLTGGIGRKQYVCGAVNAGALVLSYLYGNEKSEQQNQKDKAVQMVREYIEEFEKTFKSCQCKDIMGVGIYSKEERKKAQEMNLFATKCVECIKKVCEIINLKQNTEKSRV